MALHPGDPAPPFTLVDQHLEPAALADFAGRWLVVYAYPKDNTPGCTQEARDFSCLLEDFRRLGAEVVGVSPDNTASHQRFIERQGLGLRLLSDPDRAMLKAWGAWGPKTFMGRQATGVIRSTWIVDPRGRLAVLWSPVKVKDHAAQVLAELARLTRD